MVLLPEFNLLVEDDRVPEVLQINLPVATVGSEPQGSAPHPSQSTVKPKSNYKTRPQTPLAVGFEDSLQPGNCRIKTEVGSRPQTPRLVLDHELPGGFRAQTPVQDGSRPQTLAEGGFKAQTQSEGGSRDRTPSEEGSRVPTPSEDETSILGRSRNPTPSDDSSRAHTPVFPSASNSRSSEPGDASFPSISST